jgi:hypothetical protein
MYGSAFGNPSIPQMAARDAGSRSPNSQPAGALTGVPTRTQFFNVQVTPGQATLIVPQTRENRFIILLAPFFAFSIYVGESAGISNLNGLALPPGIPYEVTLPGNQMLYAVSNAPSHANCPRNHWRH